MTPLYTIRADGAIECHLCGAASHNHNDITNHYCARCHVFLDDAQDLIEDYQRLLVAMGMSDDAKSAALARSRVIFHLRPDVFGPHTDKAVIDLIAHEINYPSALKIMTGDVTQDEIQRWHDEHARLETAVNDAIELDRKSGK